MNSMGGITSATMIGRRAQLDALTAAFDRVSIQSRPELVLVTGEAGVGKSRLIGEFRSLIQGAPIEFLVGRCVQFGDQVAPFAPLRHVLLALLDALNSEALDLVIGSARDGLSELVPDLGGTGSSGTDPAGVGELGLGVMRRLARRSPVVLVIEDLHWADTSTRQWLSMLAGADWLGPVLIVTTLRNDELHRRHPLVPVLADLARTSRPERIELRRLDQAESEQLVAAIAGPDIDLVVAADIVRRGSGVPFFVEELIASHAMGNPDPSDALREVVLARTADFDEAAVVVLQVVAAASAISVDILAEVCELEMASLAVLLDDLVARGLLEVERDRVRFRHELGREVFDDEIGPGRRAVLHARLAAVLERRDPLCVWVRSHATGLQPTTCHGRDRARSRRQGGVACRRRCGSGEPPRHRVSSCGTEPASNQEATIEHRS